VGDRRASFVLHAKELSMLHRLGDKIVAFFKEEEGPTAVEYAVMLALIIVVCLVAITSIGTSTNATFTSVSSAVAAS
jgi:pilus assembly protein Flp/PilA